MAHRYDPIGRCVYCGATEELTREHIIPLALGGDLILPKSSCRACATLINREIEAPILNQEMKAFRTFQSLPTRRPKQRPTTFDLRNRDGTVITIPADEYYGPLPLYKFKQPRVLTGAAPVSNDHAWLMDVFGTNEEAEMALRAKYPKWDGTHRLKPQPFHFARLLAKIGYSYAAAELGLDSFLPGDVIDTILGKTKDYFRCVGGTDPEPHPGPEDEPPGHWFGMEGVFRQRGVGLVCHVVVRIRLFAKYHVPTYAVVAGEADLRNLRHFQEMERRRLTGKIARVSTQTVGRPIAT